MPITIEIEKHPLPNFAPSKYCEWCVTVTTSDPGGFKSGDPTDLGVAPLQWALDFPPDTDILDPEQAKKIKGAPKYEVNPGPGKGTITQPGAKQFKICFVAACKDREGVEMSLENRVDVPGPLGGGNDWNRVPYEDAPNGVGKIVGPVPVAMSAPALKDEISMLATFEAQKLATLIGVPVRTEARATSGAARLYVTGFTERSERRPRRR